jgi:hypothetical protein
MVAGWLASAAQADADSPAPDVPVANALCLACHQQNLTVTNGTTERRTVDAVSGLAFDTSAHNEMDCVECHTVQSALPHPKDPALPDASATVSCARCHADAYKGYREGPHGPLAELGDARAPACTDCHGNAHYLQSIQAWKETDQVAACAKCHSGAGPSFLGASPGHRPPSAGFISTPYFAGLFLKILTAATLAFGIVHVELEMLRWFTHRLARWRGTHSAKDSDDGHTD